MSLNVIMKRQLFNLLLLVSFVFSVSAQKAQTAKTNSADGNLRAHVEYLASDKLEGRRTGEKGATYAAGYIADLFANYKLKAGVSQTMGGKTKSNFLQSFPFTASVESARDNQENPAQKPSEGYNVIGILEGTDAILKNEAIIVGAHYDHLGRGGQGSLATNSTEIHHGADDNASGVAGLLQLAGEFSAARKNKRTLIFVAFGGEEEGLFGSKFYVGNPVFPLEKTVAMINLDMIGRLRDDKLTIGGIDTATEWKNLVESINTGNVINAELKNVVETALTKKGICCVTVETQNDSITLEGSIEESKLADAVRTAMEVAKVKVVNHLVQSPSGKFTPKIPFSFSLLLKEDGFGPSDHSSFYGKQIPVLFFFTGAHEDYHKPTDTADKINYGGLERVTNFVAEIVKAIDQNPKKPTYAVAKSSGTGEGRRGFNVSLGTMPNYAANSGDGLLLEAVRDESPAARAGIKANDKIVKLAGKEIRNITDYTNVLSELKADVEYEIVVVRGTETLTLKIIPAARK